MTVLEKYVRLETPGIWCESTTSAPREVVVSFRETTLVLTDLANRPLGHWALAGIRPLKMTDDATIYSMTPDGEETLSIRDADMIKAIAAVSRHNDRIAPLPKTRKRFPFAPLIALGLAAALVAYGPDLLREQAARMVPPEQAREFGERMLLALTTRHGPPCADPAGTRALALLMAEVGEGVPAHVLNLDGVAPMVTLPGPILVVGSRTLDRAASPEELAGSITASLGIDPRHGPVRDLVKTMSPLTNLRYILTGQLGEAELAKAAEQAIEASTPGQDFIAALGYSAPLLTDQQWMALRGICG